MTLVQADMTSEAENLKAEGVAGEMARQSASEV